MKIRKATIKDVSELLEIEKENFKEPYSEHMLESDLKNERNLFFACENDGKLVGYINVFHIFEEANIIKIAVSKKYQREHIGTQLLSKAIEKLKEQGVQKIYLEVNENNESAIKFYETMGFEKTSMRANYYGEDSAIIYWKYL